MRERRRVAALLLVVAVALAGCSGGGAPETTAADRATATTTAAATAETATAQEETATGETTETASDRSEVTVRGGDLPVDETAVFHRVQRVLGTDVEPQPVEVRNLTERKGYAPAESPFLRHLGLRNVSLAPDEPGGLTATSGKVYVHPGNGTPADVERVLAHEFVHTTQYRANMLPWLSAIDRPRLTQGLLQARLALIEGGAVYATDAYADRHLTGVDPAARIAERYREGSASERYLYARYHHGYRYVSDRIDSPAELERVYEDHPNTTEQILHDYSRDEEPPADLAVEANATGRWSATANDTMGELLVRVALGSELGDERAREAAAGWGNDVVYGFETGDGGPGFAWTLRFDSPAEAGEFAAAAEAYADERRAATDAAFRVERVGDETVALLVGNPALVENASVSGASANVTVSVAE